MYVLMKDFLPTIQAHADLRGKGGGVGLFWTPPPWKIQAFKIHMIVNYQQKKMTLRPPADKQSIPSVSQW